MNDAFALLKVAFKNARAGFMYRPGVERCKRIAYLCQQMKTPYSEHVIDKAIDYLYVFAVREAEAKEASASGAAGEPAKEADTAATASEEKQT